MCSGVYHVTVVLTSGDGPTGGVYGGPWHVVIGEPELRTVVGLPEESKPDC
jgi:hypothetical protein